MAFIAPEFQSVEAFVQFCMDDEQITFVPGDAQKIAAVMKRPITEIIAELKGYGLSLRMNHVQRSDVRGCTSNPNGTFPFSGANSTYATPGGDSISGFAGRAGS